MNQSTKQQAQEFEHTHAEELIKSEGKTIQKVKEKELNEILPLDARLRERLPASIELSDINKKFFELMFQLYGLREDLYNLIEYACCFFWDEERTKKNIKSYNMPTEWEGDDEELGIANHFDNIFNKTLDIFSSRIRDNFISIYFETQFQNKDIKL